MKVSDSMASWILWLLVGPWTSQTGRKPGNYNSISMLTKPSMLPAKP